MDKASIAIFKKAVEYGSDSIASVPDELFAAAKRVIENKGSEVLRLGREGFYIVQYSENGPFQELLSDEWLPVYIARVEKWSSGGIKKQQAEEHDAR